MHYLTSVLTTCRNAIVMSVGEQLVLSPKVICPQEYHPRKYYIHRAGDSIPEERSYQRHAESRICF